MEYDAIATLETRPFQKLRVMYWRVVINSGRSKGAIGLCCTADAANKFTTSKLGSTTTLASSTDSERRYIVR